jgi:hypothetical protein
VRRLATAEAAVRPGAVTSRSTTTLNAARKRKLVHLTLSPDAIAALAELATSLGSTRSGIVEALIRRAQRRATTAR